MWQKKRYKIVIAISPQQQIAQRHAIAHWKALGADYPLVSIDISFKVIAPKARRPVCPGWQLPENELDVETWISPQQQIVPRHAIGHWKALDEGYLQVSIDISTKVIGPKAFFECDKKNEIKLLLRFLRNNTSPGGMPRLVGKPRARAIRWYQ